jgi:Transposase DDE domain
MSGLALFGMKYPSLLSFNKDYHNEPRIRHNLLTLYDVKNVPSDTYLRERLDGVSQKGLQKGVDRIIAQLQRGKVLECYRYWQEHLLIAIDASGYFSSHEIRCENCCVKNHRDGTKTFYHQMLAAVVVHPAYRNVFPLMLEPIIKTDGMVKNDCEHNALKRLLLNLRNAHPHLKMIVTLDGLYADGVIIKLLKKLNIHFIISAHEKDLKHLYEFYSYSKKGEMQKIESKKEQKYAWANQLPLNDTHHACEVNLVCFEERTAKKVVRYDLVTDIGLDKDTALLVTKGGRARWHIENETFNTLKNQGYQFEHNFGHGYKNLSVVMAYLMFTAFLIDQVQEFSCKHFQKALKKSGRLCYLWGKMRSYFFLYFIDSWADLYKAITESIGARLTDLLPDTS